jgi:hypothetical protein
MNSILRLENISGMTNDDKGSLLLVAGDLKPSALVIIQGDIFPLSDNPVHVPKQTIDNIKSILSSFELIHFMTVEVLENSSNKPYEHGQEVLRIFISKDKTVANQLKLAFDEIGKHHREAGLLLGYPESAVDAFLTDKMLDWKEHPISTPEVSEVNMRLLGHRLSKDNWRNEVMYLEASGNYIRSMSSKI